MIVVVQTHDDIFKGVKQESSLLAERRTDQQGTPTFEELVFDEEYITLYRELFFDARANVESACSAYMLPEGEMYFDNQNFDIERDLVLQLEIPDFKSQMINNVSIKMKAYLVAYIMYRWLETKLPGEAGTYLSRANETLKDMKRFMEMRNTRRKIKGSTF